jgi:hypothetical protein
MWVEILAGTTVYLSKSGLNLINSIYGILKAKYYPDISKEEGLDMRV